MKRTLAAYILIVAAVLTAKPAEGRAERIKDICNVNGVRSNPLIGYGLVMEATSDIHVLDAVRNPS